jgi:methenyltetrahydrofolate cyclohydrolase
MSSDFLTELAQARPDPGGGAAAAYGARVALALLMKVVLLELARPQPREAESRGWGELLARLQEAGDALLRLQQEDVQAYFGLTRARTAGEAAGLAAAVGVAVETPRRILQQAGGVLELLAQAASGCKKHLVSDLLVACELLGGSFRGAYHIARANLPLVPEASGREALAAQLTQTLHAAEAHYEQARNALLRR